MKKVRRSLWVAYGLLLGALPASLWSQELPIEVSPTDSNLVKIVLISGSNVFKLRFVPEMKGVAPLLRTVSPKAASQELTNEAVVAWLFGRSNGSRSFNFTGTHLHASLAEEGYRRFLVNGILWSAGIEIPKSGAPVTLTSEGLNKYLKPAPAKK